ncbi:ArsC family reductase [Oceanisphaera sp.]|uniref:ArsC family reductase n=1 Tax=Oceanisphaera sp. TaxID=1929979 RepID=UPI003A922B59
MTIKLYGIKNCDTIKKARKWLEQHDIGYQFIDHRVDGLDTARLHLWLDKLGWEQLVNKRSTTYRALSDTDKANLGADTAAALLEANPTLIKRPLLEQNGEFTVGFNDALYSRVLNKD